MYCVSDRHIRACELKSRAIFYQRNAGIRRFSSSERRFALLTARMIGRIIFLQIAMIQIDSLSYPARGSFRESCHTNQNQGILKQHKTIQQSVQLTCGSLRGLGAFFWLRAFFYISNIVHVRPLAGNASRWAVPCSISNPRRKS
jgi:hypothetical protein